MLTRFGKFLRKLRIDNLEILKDMSDKLGVSPSFLSSVENGKKKIPNNWKDKIASLYNLNPEQIIELDNSIIKTNKEIILNLEDLDSEHQELAVSFARQLDKISLEKFTELVKILEEKETK